MEKKPIYWDHRERELARCVFLFVLDELDREIDREHVHRISKMSCQWTKREIEALLSNLEVQGALRDVERGEDDTQ